ncbi:MAG: ABA4-like family protein [Litorilinea sp.]
MEILFQIANLYILPFWLLMILLPGWRGSQRIMASIWTVIPLAAFYALGFVMSFSADPTALQELANPTLTGIAALLGTPAGAALGWIHFLAFDLFVGRWAYLDSRTRGISAWWVSPALIFVLMAGPLGLLLYLGVRYLHRGQRQSQRPAR